MKILRNEKDLTPEMLEKIKNWVKNLTWQDFEAVKYNKDAKEFLKREKKLQTVQTINDILHFGIADAEPVILFNELFIVDSIHSRGDLCICKHINSKKHHIVLHKIAKKSDYKNYCSGYFAVPFL